MRNAGTRGDEEQTVHAITVDVEDYFHPAAFRNAVRRDEWDNMESRVERNTEICLELFASAGVHATFFILGWVAERFPKLVRKIYEAGHELGCHSYHHRFIYELTPEEFRQDTARAKDAIQNAAGAAVECYRAPSFSITSKSAWSLEILAQLGFSQDSSIFPIHHDLYGFPDAPVRPFRIDLGGASILEFPPPTVAMWRWRVPVSGGGYLRILPFTWQMHLLRRLHRRQVPFVIYVHPWEFDPDQPRLPGPPRSRYRQYTGIRRTAGRLAAILSEFKFGTVSDSLSSQVRDNFSLSRAGDRYQFVPKPMTRTVDEGNRELR